MDLGKTIKDIRQEKKLSQEQLAKHCGISQTYLSQIERNQKEPTLTALKAIAISLEIPLPILFFLSLDEQDISPEKRDAFNTLGATFKAVIHEFFEV